MRRCSTLSSWTRPPSWRTPVTEWSVCVSLTHSLYQLDHSSHLFHCLPTHTLTSFTTYILAHFITHLIAYPLTHSSTHFNHSHTYSLTHSCNYTHSPTCSFTDTLTHSMNIISLNCTFNSLTHPIDSGTANREHSK